MKVSDFEETYVRALYISVYGNIVHSYFISDKYFFGDKQRNKWWSSWGIKYWKQNLEVGGEEVKEDKLWGIWWTV